jgi:hypothetical protein
MQKIENCMQQPLVITCSNGRVVHLLAEGKAVLSDEEIGTAHIQLLLGQSFIRILGRQASPRGMKYKASHHKREEK